jgi:signal transduction histidine kinase
MVSVFMILVLNFIFFTTFGANPQTFLYVTIPLLLSSIFIGYFLAKEVLKPLFDRNKALDKFVKDTLHEINIPVATIQANTEMLKRKESDPKILKRLDRIEIASKNLLSLYNELNYRIKEEIDCIEYEEFSVYEAISESIDKFDEIKKDITINIEVDRSLHIFSDKNGFIRVIDNLISNAIKYNQDNGTIDIYTEHEELIVSDSGIGIDEHDLIHIFDRYYQEDSLKSGFGIGLHVVKSFCDRHKIDIKIESKRNFGTRFRLNLQKVCQNLRNNKKLIKKG